ncbi:hypothetical protein PIB30_027466 [Stylosanthes scabra]|uniref:Uncharacterized protein n=1 Tax=Stylosanthes scabra TaxID=79078 RepID=A0ABU6ZAI6_9FABA|nr:hypothetical protein [Stylosanthes scabra]
MSSIQLKNAKLQWEIAYVKGRYKSLHANFRHFKHMVNSDLIGFDSDSDNDPLIARRRQFLDLFLMCLLLPPWSLTIVSMPCFLELWPTLIPFSSILVTISSNFWRPFYLLRV